MICNVLRWKKVIWFERGKRGFWELYLKFKMWKNIAFSIRKKSTKDKTPGAEYGKFGDVLVDQAAWLMGRVEFTMKHLEELDLDPGSLIWASRNKWFALSKLLRSSCRTATTATAARKVPSFIGDETTIKRKCLVCSQARKHHTDGRYHANTPEADRSAGI